VWVLLVTAGACSGDDKSERLCRQISATVCDHQLECDIVTDVFACEQEFEDRYQCDPEATDEQLQTCIDAAKVLECPAAVPFLCFEVLCEEVVGCVDTPTSTADTGTTPLTP
jgi:hypothetical protein